MSVDSSVGAANSLLPPTVPAETAPSAHTVPTEGDPSHASAGAPGAVTVKATVAVSAPNSSAAESANSTLSLSSGSSLPSAGVKTSPLRDVVAVAGAADRV